MWKIGDDGVREYRMGKNDWSGAARMAGLCKVFQEDVEEEIVADDPVSCYNCRFRRWTETSFTCFHPGSGPSA